MRKITTWVIVADHQHVRAFSNDGPNRGLSPVAGWELVNPLKRGRDIMADRQGRSFDSQGMGRHAMEPHTDPRRTEAKRFLTELVAKIRKAAESKSFDRMVLVAPPRTLGELRQLLPDNVRNMIVEELAEDLTKHPVDKVLEHVQKVLPV